MRGKEFKGLGLGTHEFRIMAWGTMNFRPKMGYAAELIKRV